MRREVEYVVPENRDGVLLREILRREVGISAGLLRRMKQMEGSILKNDVPAFVTVPVKAGDVLKLVLEEERGSDGVVPTEGTLDIYYENEDVLVVSKPGDMSVHPSHGHFTTSLANIVVYHYNSLGHQFVFRPVNRLDRGTSGLMAIAKNAYAHAFFTDMMKEGRFTREYLAICEGVPFEARGTINAPIARREGSAIEREVSSDGKRAITHYEVLEVYKGRALVKLRLETGRTHQIRVHMAHIGCPLVGDFLYGAEEGDFSRVALHSATLKTPLPFCNKTIELKSDMPQDMCEKFYR